MEGRRCRFIIDTPRRGSLNLALDLAVLQAVARGAAPPTIRLYRWEQPTVTIGYFQILQEAVHDDDCRRDRVPVIRRITGGGAVLHEHELAYAVAIPLKTRTAGGAVLDSVRDICRPLIRTLQALSIEAVFRPVNDIVVGNRKIAGCAQTRRDGVLLQHGTLLIDIDKRNMTRYLKAGREKSLENSLGLTCLKDFLGCCVNRKEYLRRLSNDLVQAYRNEWGLELSRGTFSAGEVAAAGRIELELFANAQWNTTRRLPV